MPEKIMSMFKDLLKIFFRFLRIEVRRVQTPNHVNALIPIEIRQLAWLKQLPIKTVIDIGANTGQFSQKICQLLPNAKIYAFEPLPDCYSALIATFDKNSNFTAFNVALGNQTGQAKIYQNEFSPASSLLPLAALHKQTFPYAQEVLMQEIKVFQLDDLAKNLELDELLLIKVDVQGFEHQVIEGGISIFQRASVVIIELSIFPLYEEQICFDGIYKKLMSLGFQYYGNYDQAHDRDGRVIYVDSIFFNEQISN